MIKDQEFHPPTWSRRPPGMVYDDSVPWSAWLQGPGMAWSGYAYDVHLYTQAVPPGEIDPAMVRLWVKNTAKRIDAVGRIDGHLDIFEARRFCGWSAIAQLLGYRDLWLINFPDNPMRDMYLIVELIDDPVRALAHRHGIKTWAIGEPAAA